MDTAAVVDDLSKPGAYRPSLNPALVSGGYGAEIRFGVVMYGGVSLAIYINGVTNELFEMACATPREGFGLLGDSGDAPTTREVYRRLSWLLGSKILREAYAARLKRGGEGDPWDAVRPLLSVDTNSPPTRLVVDVISGTSAGGINGIFLAKALANGQQFAPLRQMWIDEGDFGLLLNDRPSYRLGLPTPIADRSKAPTSLLNSDRMYAKLAAAMSAMDAMQLVARPSSQEPIPAAGDSPLVDEVDLFVTTTDIKGSPVPLRLFDKVVYELRFKQSYHFGYPYGAMESGNDFEDADSPFLAFAARCTSSFPFAFEPMTLDAVYRLRKHGGAELSDLPRWKPFFPNLPPEEVAADRHLQRAFGDGGYLDNKPFSYVVETLSQRFSSVPVERKLVYVEPSPEHLSPPAAEQQAPDALSNALAALTSIPRYETIREDLQAVLQRNRRIERIERLVRLGERDLDQHNPMGKVGAVPANQPAWGTLPLSAIIARYGLAFVPHWRLRMNAVTDSLAERLGGQWGIDPASDEQYALRALVRVWRESKFNDQGDQGRQTNSAFLDQFDTDYRIRRLGYLLRKADQLIHLMRKRCAVPIGATLGSELAELSEAELQMLKRLPSPFGAAPDAPTTQQVRAALAAVLVLKKQLVAIRRRMLVQQRLSAREAVPDEVLALRPVLKVTLKLLLDGESLGSDELALLGEQGAQLARSLQQLAVDKVPSVSRTLQESILLRAELLWGAANSQSATPLQLALQRGLGGLRYKPGPDESGSAEWPLMLLGNQVAQLLGDPQLRATSKAAVDVAGVNRPVLDRDEGRAMREFLGTSFRYFDMFDQMSFSLYYDTGTGEPSTVEVVRISPVDATRLIDEAKQPGRRKLAGTVLANFGAFLEKRWRLNDIMWGRLDGAERLIEALLPAVGSENQPIRDELIRLAHQAILRETMGATGQADLSKLLIGALNAATVASPKVPERAPTVPAIDAVLRQQVSSLVQGGAAAELHLSGILSSLLGAPGLLAFVRKDYQIDRQPDPKTTLENSARAVRITGRVLEVISDRYDRGSWAGRWLARAGLALQGLVAVSVPGALARRITSRLVQLLYAFELVAVVLAVFLGSGDMRTLAWTALGLTVGVHLLIWFIGDLMGVRHGGRWLRRLIAGAALTVVVLLAAMLACRFAPLPSCAPAAAPVCTVCGWLLGRNGR